MIDYRTWYFQCDDPKHVCELSSLTIVWELRVGVRGFPSMRKWQSKETPPEQSWFQELHSVLQFSVQRKCGNEVRQEFAKMVNKT